MSLRSAWETWRPGRPPVERLSTLPARCPEEPRRHVTVLPHLHDWAQEPDN